jgi:hypothetical protein
MSSFGRVNSGLPEAFRVELARRNAYRTDSAMVRWLDDHRSLVVFLLLIVVGLVLALYHDALPWVSVRSTGRTLADALIVAGILGMTVDYFLKRALIKDVGSIFIGWALPQEIRTRIREVSETSIVRKNYDVRYKLTPTDDPDWVRVEINTKAEIYNFSTGIRRFEPTLSLDLQDNPDESATTFQLERNGKTECWDAAQLNASGRKTRDSHVVTWRARPILLPPQDATSPDLKPACVVRWTWESRMRVAYTDFLACTIPTIDVDISVDCPAGMEFVADSPTVKHDGSSRWLYRRLYMPGESLRVRWWPAGSEHQKPSDKEAGKTAQNHAAI